MHDNISLSSLINNTISSYSCTYESLKVEELNIVTTESEEARRLCQRSLSYRGFL